METEYTDIKTVEVDMICPRCKRGHMRRDADYNVVLATYPALYPHKCNMCGYVENYTKAYPYIKYVKLVPEDKWISCSDNLPEDNSWVICQIKENEGTLWIPRILRYDKEKDDWYDHKLGWIKQNSDDYLDVVAWMKCPDAYDGGNIW